MDAGRDVEKKNRREAKQQEQKIGEEEKRSLSKGQRKGRREGGER